jgi:hypothetical protein
MDKKQMEKNEIIRLTNKTSFSPNDLVSLRNLYLKYINKKANICLSCPGALRHFVKVFQEHSPIILKKHFNPPDDPSLPNHKRSSKSLDLPDH